MNPSPETPAERDRGTILAEDRTDAALERTRMAAERTLMAWIRTTLSMIGFGFTIVKFFQYLEHTGTGGGWRPHAPRNLGVSLVILGTGMLVLAIVQHWIFLKRLRHRSGGRRPVSLAMVAAFFIILLGLFALLNLLFAIGSF